MPAAKHASESPSQLHRQRWLRERTAARTLRGAFPDVERVRVDLKFEDAAAPPPGEQSHAMHPAARAFFEFLCPHMDCDGGFDLGDAATSVLTRASPRAAGTLECKGTRPAAGMTKQPCGVRVRYTILAHYRSADRALK
jgi:hypothetical protein